VAFNVGNEQNNFKGEINDRNVLIHALNYFKKLEADYVTRMFPNVTEEEITLIQTIIITSNYFDEHYSKSALHKLFKIKPEVYKRVHEIGAEDFLSEHEKNKTEQINFEFLIKEQVVYEVNKLRDEFKDASETKRIAKSAKRWSIAASVATVLTLILLLIQWMCNKHG
jgi:hypothetical protein